MYPTFTSVNNDEVRESALEVLRLLPARTETEILYVLELANDTSDEPVQKACVYVLRYASPEEEDARKVLEEKGKKSRVKVVREVVEERLRERR